MRECAGNYSIPTANGNVEGVDKLAGAGIIELPKYFTEQTPVNAPHCSVDNCRFCCQVTSVVHKGFLSKLSICRPNLYWQ